MEIPTSFQKTPPKTNMDPPQNESSDGFPFFGVIFKWNMLVFGEYTPTNLGFSINYYYVTMSDHWRVKSTRGTRFCLSVFSARLFFLQAWPLDYTCERKYSDIFFCHFIPHNHDILMTVNDSSYTQQVFRFKEFWCFFRRSQSVSQMFVRLDQFLWFSLHSRWLKGSVIQFVFKFQFSSSMKDPSSATLFWDT